MGETVAIYIIAAVTWWTFAVAALAIILNSERLTMMGVAMAIFWPLVIPIGAVVIPYRAFVHSTRTIKTDIRNRKLMHEFEQFLAARKGDILQKEATHD